MTLEQQQVGKMIAPETPSPEQVKVFRHKWDLTQTELGVLLGVTLSTVQNWEYEVSEPPPYLSLALRDIDRRKKMSEAQRVRRQKAKARGVGIRRNRKSAEP